jgi:RNA-directed DNA polymerase
MNTTKEINTMAIGETERAWLSVETPSDLCRLLKTPFFELEQMMNHPVYRSFTIEKRRGGNREIFSPDPDLKRIQRRLNYFLQAHYRCIKPKEVHGFVINPHHPGAYCNIVENAAPHVGKRYLLNIDLKEFFPGISGKRIREIFRSPIFGFNENIANALTLLTTYRGHLPIGAPTSPAISNFVCYRLDSDLVALCERLGFSYTRYADDLTFSSQAPITPAMIEGVRQQIENNHFAMNNQKTRLTTLNRRQTVTGLTVNEKVNVDRKLLKKIRAMLHDWKVNGLMASTRHHFGVQGEVNEELQRKFREKLQGYIQFTVQVKGKTGGRKWDK